MLQINNLLKKYGDKTILDIENLCIEKGIIHLKGINGSGKSTFSKIVAGLIPFHGEVKLFDSLSPTEHKVEYRKQVNYSESEPNYPDILSANDLISFVGKAKGASTNSLISIPEAFGVNAYLYDSIGTYSSGMLKRLSLCLAFLGNPSLILLDEPFNTLDTKAIELLKNMIAEQHENGVNFILISHQNIAKLGMPIDRSYLVKDHTITAE
jgi:ABC-2 type transport system ATP-binding protein